MTRRLLFVTPDLSDNSLGRTYALALLAEEIGWDFSVVSSRGSVWEPLLGTSFAESCSVVDLKSSGFLAVLADYDLIIAVKPLLESFAPALRASRRTKTPLVLDIDDPDLEQRIGSHAKLTQVRRFVRHPLRTLRYRRLATRVRDVETLVSNPVLQRRYGGTIIPHARPDLGDGDAHTSTQPSIVFVGTNRVHKGVPLLRAAVGCLQHLGVTLTVTDVPPADAKPWEIWTGNLPLSQGMNLVRGADIVALPSDSSHEFAPAQLPAKLIDAMMYGRAVIVSDTEPMRWAVDDAGLIFPSMNLDELISRIRQFASPEVRAAFGAAARLRALHEFSVPSVAGRFRDACESAIRAGASTRPADVD